MSYLDPVDASGEFLVYVIRSSDGLHVELAVDCDRPLTAREFYQGLQTVLKAFEKNPETFFNRLEINRTQAIWQ